jgi:hypothetical protein
LLFCLGSLRVFLAKMRDGVLRAHVVSLPALSTKMCAPWFLVR